MAPFQVNGNTQGLFGLAPPLVKHSGGGAGCAEIQKYEKSRVFNFHKPENIFVCTKDRALLK